MCIYMYLANVARLNIVGVFHERGVATKSL